VRSGPIILEGHMVHNQQGRDFATWEVESQSHQKLLKHEIMKIS
jgi:hypothetical protein